MTEKEFLSQVIDLAHHCGWMVAHFRPGKTAKGWRTAVQGDGKGFPDLVCLRDDEMIVLELKVGRNKLTPEQREWIMRFAMLPQCFSHVVYPKDWDLLVRVFSGGNAHSQSREKLRIPAADSQ